MVPRNNNNFCLRLVTTASLAAFVGSGFISAPPVIAAAPTQPFVAPAGKLLLTRTLQRSLHDGKEVITRRIYEVQIVRDDPGFRVDGKLIDVQVETPPMLAALAEIERKRPDIGMFPILLNAQGMIIGGDSIQEDGSLDRASTVVSGRIANSGLPALEMLQAQAFVKQLRARRPRSVWPADVFNPSMQTQRETRNIPVPGGEAGQVLIELSSRGHTSSGQISELERLVITDLNGDKRVTRETWRLSRSDSRVIR